LALESVVGVLVGGGRAVALGDGEGREEGGEILIRYGGGDGGGGLHS
jgi:hypothetical protein